MKLQSKYKRYCIESRTISLEFVSKTLAGEFGEYCLRFSSSEPLSTFEDLRLREYQSKFVGFGEDSEEKRKKKEPHFSNVCGIGVWISSSNDSFRDQYLLYQDRFHC